MAVQPLNPYEYNSRPGVSRVADITDTDAVTAWLTDAGYTVLEDSDVIDKGSYALLSENVPGSQYETHGSEHEVHDLMPYYNTKDIYAPSSARERVLNKVTIYPSKPLRVTGVFRDTSDWRDKYHFLFVGSPKTKGGVPTQRRIVVQQGDIHPIANNTYQCLTIHHNMTPITPGDVPADVRSVYRRAVVAGMPDRFRYENQRLFSNLDENRNAMSAHGVIQTGTHIGIQYVYWPQWGTVKQQNRAFGELVKQCKHDPTDDSVVQAAVEMLSDHDTLIRHHLLRAWNNAETGRDLEMGACGHIFEEGLGHSTHNGEVCGECFEDNYVYCDDSEDYRQRDHVYYHEEDDVYRTYEDVVDGSNYTWGQLSSWGSSTAELAHDKSFVPSSNGDFTMGIELEVEATRDRYKRVQAAHAALNDGSRNKLYAMFKSDGSLSEEKGFEVVTAARRMGDHITKFKGWEPTGLRSWDAGNCGMHVHIDSRAFTGLTLGKFLMFFNMPDNAAFIKDIAGRHPNTDAGAANYARALSDYVTENPVRVKDENENESRYRMVNVTNLTTNEQDRLGINVDRNSKGDYSTVEVRIFRGTLRKDRLLAQIEFAHAAVAFCRVASWQELDGDAFKLWLSKTGGYPHLRRWFGVSRSRNKNLTTAANRQPVEAEI